MPDEKSNWNIDILIANNDWKELGRDWNLADSLEKERIFWEFIKSKGDKGAFPNEFSNELGLEPSTASNLRDRLLKKKKIKLHPEYAQADKKFAKKKYVVVISETDLEETETKKEQEKMEKAIISILDKPMYFYDILRMERFWDGLTTRRPTARWQMLWQRIEMYESDEPLGRREKLLELVANSLGKDKKNPAFRDMFAEVYSKIRLYKLPEYEAD